MHLRPNAGKPQAQEGRARLQPWAAPSPRERRPGAAWTPTSPRSGARRRRPVETPTGRSAGQWGRELEAGPAEPKDSEVAAASWTEKEHTRGSTRRGGAEDTERRAPLSREPGAERPPSQGPGVMAPPKANTQRLGHPGALVFYLGTARVSFVERLPHCHLPGGLQHKQLGSLRALEGRSLSEAAGLGALRRPLPCLPACWQTPPFLAYSRLLHPLPP
nr:uncharacterized protein LOC112921557 [Vulpes vulpes]